MKQATRRTFLAGVASTLGAATAVGSSTAVGRPPNHLVVAGGSPRDPVRYMLVVDDRIEKTDDAGSAPVADRHVTVDPSDDLRDGQYVTGSVAGGADAYRYAGAVVNFGVEVTADTAEKVTLYRDGEAVPLDRFGQHPSAGTPVEFADGRTVTVHGEWADVRAHTTAMYDSGVGTSYESMGSVSGTTTLTPEWVGDRPYALDSVELYEDADAVSDPAHVAENPFAGPWNLERGGGDGDGGSGRNADGNGGGGTGEQGDADGNRSLPNHLVVFGGGGGTELHYEFGVSGEVRKDGSGGRAPIADRYVTVDDSDTISGSTVTGTVAGGGDAYRFSGDVTRLTADEGVRVFVNGKRRR